VSTLGTVKNGAGRSTPLRKIRMAPPRSTTHRPPSPGGAVTKIGSFVPLRGRSAAACAEAANANDARTTHSIHASTLSTQET